MSESRKVVVITGGTAGVGRAAVREFAGRGYDVAILARGRAGLDAAAADVQEQGGRALALETDVSDGAAVEAAAARIETELGPIDVWVNNAFVGALSYFWDTDAEDYRRMTEVTYFGQVNGTRAALQRMRPRDRGVIVNVSSALAHRGIPLQSAYCGAKHAVKGFSESVMAELRADGSKVRIGLVTLPGINTPQFDWNDNHLPDHPQPNPPIFQPEVAARAIVEQAEHPRRNVWVGFATAATVLGNRVAPGFVDWYLGRNGIDSQQTQEDLPRHGSNVYEPQDETADRGAHGPFDDKAKSFDPVSLLSSTVGRAVEVTVDRTLDLVGAVLDLRK